MTKSIIKEITIVLLIILAIILTLCVVLYDYVPLDIEVPETKTYATSEEIKEELSSNISNETTNVVLTYEIDGTDLSNYEKVNEYEPGKVNPFSTYKVENQETPENNTIDNTNTNSSNSTNTTTKDNKNNTNSYFKDKGTK